MSKRSSKQELQKPDEFVEFSHKMADWVTVNANLILGGFLVVALTIGGVVFARTSAASNREDRSADFINALQTYHEGLSARTADERDKKMDEAGKAFREFANESRDELGAFAVYMEGNAWHNRGIDYRNFEKALELYKEYLGRVSSRSDKAQAHLAIGYSHESLAFGRRPEMEAEEVKRFQSKHSDEALAAYQKAEENAPEKSWVRSEAMLARARVLSAMKGRQKEALDLARKVQQDRAYKAPVETLEKSVGTPEEREKMERALSIVQDFGLANSAELLAFRIESSLKAVAAPAPSAAPQAAAAVAASDAAKASAQPEAASAPAAETQPAEAAPAATTETPISSEAAPAAESQPAPAEAAPAQ